MLAGSPARLRSAVSLIALRHRSPSDIAAASPTIFQHLPAARTASSPGHAASVPVPQLAVSPDGRHLAFVAADPQGRSLWLRTLGEPESRRWPGPKAPSAVLVTRQPDGRVLRAGLLKNTDHGGTAARGHRQATVDSRGGAWNHRARSSTHSGNAGVSRPRRRRRSRRREPRYASGDSRRRDGRTSCPTASTFCFRSGIARP